MIQESTIKDKLKYIERPMKDLTNSNIDRQNILNNRFALEKIQEYIGVSGLFFEGEYKFTTQMVADFYGVEERTIKRYLENYEQELKHNGYILSKGKQLKDLKLQFGHVINVPSKTTQLGLFNFRAFFTDQIYYNVTPSGFI